MLATAWEMTEWVTPAPDTGAQTVAGLTEQWHVGHEDPFNQVKPLVLSGRWRHSWNLGEHHQAYKTQDQCQNNNSTVYSSDQRSMLSVLRPHGAYASVSLVIIGSGSGLAPDRRQAITWTNIDLLSIGWKRTADTGKHPCVRGTMRLTVKSTKYISRPFHLPQLNGIRFVVRDFSFGDCLSQHVKQWSVTWVLNWWLSTRLQYLQCISTGDTAVLQKAIEMQWSIWCDWAWKAYIIDQKWVAWVTAH